MQNTDDPHFPSQSTRGHPHLTGPPPGSGYPTGGFPGGYPAAMMQSGLPYPGAMTGHHASMQGYPPSHTAFLQFQQYMAASSGNPTMQPGGSNVFSGAHDFVMNSPNFSQYHIQNVNMQFEHGVPVLNHLLNASIKGTAIDSTARYPPPRCHPGTRVTMTTSISNWMENAQDVNRRWDLLWLFGFAGVGKTAVAQTIGEKAKELDHPLLGAAFFFSRTRKQNDPQRVFISIAYQLATVNRQYRHFVNEQLMEDPDLLDKNMRTQFRRLLIEPLSKVKLDKKLLIIVDGLDECAGEIEQEQIIELVSEAAKPPSSLPVIWMICSRPESHIKKKFSNVDSKIDCWRQELKVDDSDARRDIEIYLRAQFKDIMKRYYVTVDEDGNWPSTEDMEKVVSAASGLFIYASTAAKFIGDSNVADPDSQLRALIEFIEDSPAKSATTNPLHYLDKLYEQILSDVQPQLLQLVLQILGTSQLYPALSILQLANLFDLSEGKFYSTLIRLHSVVEVPLPEKASRDSLRFFHASFFDFLKNANRSGRFAVYPYRIHAEFAKACFNVLNQTKLRYAKNLAWPPKAGDTPAFSVAHQILAYAAANVWDSCMNLEDVGDTSLFDVIVNFRYPFLRFIEDKIPVKQFSNFIQWLLKQIRIRKIQDIVQPVKWKDEYLQETFGPTAIDKTGINTSTGNNTLSSFTLGIENKSVTVMLSSDFIILSCED